MTSKLDFNSAIQQNLNRGTTFPQMTSQPNPRSVPISHDSTLATYEPTNKPNLFSKFIDGYWDLLPKVVEENGKEIPVELPFWKRTAGYLALVAALPVIGVYFLLEKTGFIKYDPDAHLETKANVTTQKK